MRVRLLGLAAATTSLVIIAFLVPLLLLVRSLARENALNEGLLKAQQLLAAIEGTTTIQGLRELVPAQAPADRISSAIWLGADGWIGPVPPDPDSPSLVVAGGSSGRLPARQVNVAYHGGLEIWSPVVWGDRTVVVRTFVPASIVHRGVLSATLILGGTSALLLAVALFVADRFARRIAAPVRALSSVAHRLSAGDLEARARLDGPPEVIEVARALNTLAGRIGELLDAEREQVADLSHRLRTPLAAVRLAAEALPPSGETARVLDHVDALERAVSNVIREARRGVRAVRPATCDIVAVVRQRVSFWSVLAEDQDRPLTICLPAGPCLVNLEADELAAAVDALLENVFAHTPEGAGLCVKVDLDEGFACLIVADDGPGIPDGVGLRGRSGSGSTGLGLDIVQRTAQKAGGSMSIGRSASGGALVRVRLALA